MGQFKILSNVTQLHLDWNRAYHFLTYVQRILLYGGPKLVGSSSMPLLIKLHTTWKWRSRHGAVGDAIESPKVVQGLVGVIG
jgi:hypothetical protein